MGSANAAKAHAPQYNPREKGGLILGQALWFHARVGHAEDYS